MFTQKVASWEGSMAQKTWKLLQQSLDRYDSAENGWGYRKVTLLGDMSFLLFTSIFRHALNGCWTKIQLVLLRRGLRRSSKTVIQST